jgi:hypothetical protein
LTTSHSNTVTSFMDDSLEDLAYGAHVGANSRGNLEGQMIEPTFFANQRSS